MCGIDYYDPVGFGQCGVCNNENKQAGYENAPQQEIYSVTIVKMHLFMSRIK